MKEIKLTGKIEFCEEHNKQFNRTFTATLKRYGGFQYGNSTCVVIEWGEMANGKRPMVKYLDTRYDTSIKKNLKSFKEWVIKWFSENYESHELTINE